MTNNNVKEAKFKALQKLMQESDKKYGKNSLTRLGDRPDTKVETFSTGSLAIDIATGVGGLPRGRIIEIYGPESSGKCLTKDALILTKDGLVSVEEILAQTGQKADTELSRATDVREYGLQVINEKGELENIVATTHNGVKKVKRITLEDGRTLTATLNHPIRVRTEEGGVEWRNVEDLSDGMTVVSQLGGVDKTGNDTMPIYIGTVMGYLASEGVVSRDDGFDFVNCSDGDIRADFSRLILQTAESLGAEDTRVEEENETAIKVSSKAFRTALAEKLGVGYDTNTDKQVPYSVRTSGGGIQSAFLSALFDLDGWMDESGEIGCSIPSKKLADEVQVMLRGFGIASTLTRRDDSEKWTLLLNAVNSVRFVDRVGFCFTYSIVRSSKLTAQNRDNARQFDKADPRYDIEYSYESIVNIEDMGEQPTFDISVENTHSFIANGIVNHNTTLALHAIASAQQSGGIAAFIDAEHALDPEYAANLGVNTDDLMFSQPGSGEEALQLVEMMANSQAVDLIVVDSVAALTPEAEIKGEIGDSHVGLQARLMSQALRKITSAVNNSKTTVIFINQLREKVGVFFGSPETTSGGKALKFYASMRIDVRRTGSEKGSDGSEILNKVKVKTVKNKVAPPFRIAETKIYFGTGFNKASDILEIGIARGYVRKSGSWISYGDQQLGQGFDNARIFLERNPQVANEIEGKIRNALEEEKQKAKAEREAKLKSMADGAADLAEVGEVNDVPDEGDPDDYED